MRVAASKNSLAASYVSGHTFIGVASADPGTTATPANEATGGGYSREATVFSAGGTGVQSGTQESVDLPAGTWAWMLLCGAGTGNNMWDNCTISSTVLGSPGPLIITPTVTVA